MAAAEDVEPRAHPAAAAAALAVVLLEGSFLFLLCDAQVYIAFFTLTGMTLQLDAVLPNLLAAFLIFSLRTLGIYAGSYVGSASKSHRGHVRLTRPHSRQVYRRQARRCAGAAHADLLDDIHHAGATPG